MTRWVGAWPGQWPGDWQGGQEASPFASMAMRVTVTIAVHAALDALSGEPAYVDLAMVVSASAAMNASLSVGEDVPQVLPAVGGASPRRRRPAFRPSFVIAPAVEPIAARRRRRETEALLLVGAL